MTEQEFFETHTPGYDSLDELIEVLCDESLEGPENIAGLRDYLNPQPIEVRDSLDDDQREYDIEAEVVADEMIIRGNSIDDIVEAKPIDKKVSPEIKSLFYASPIITSTGLLMTGLSVYGYLQSGAEKLSVFGPIGITGLVMAYSGVKAFNVGRRELRKFRLNLEKNIEDQLMEYEKGTDRGFLEIIAGAGFLGLGAIINTKASEWGLMPSLFFGGLGALDLFRGIRDVAVNQYAIKKTLNKQKILEVPKVEEIKELELKQVSALENLESYALWGYVAGGFGGLIGLRAGYDLSSALFGTGTTAATVYGLKSLARFYVKRGIKKERKALETTQSQPEETRGRLGRFWDRATHLSKESRDYFTSINNFNRYVAEGMSERLFEHDRKNLESRRKELKFKKSHVNYEQSRIRNRKNRKNTLDNLAEQISGNKDPITTEQYKLLHEYETLGQHPEISDPQAKVEIVEERKKWAELRSDIIENLELEASYRIMGSDWEEILKHDESYQDPSEIYHKRIKELSDNLDVFGYSEEITHFLQDELLDVHDFDYSDASLARITKEMEGVAQEVLDVLEISQELYNWDRK